MLLTQLDMPAARYAFALLATGEICQKREGFISYRIDVRKANGNISSSRGWGSPKRRMSFGGSQYSENISSSSFVNIFHESEYIDRKKNKSKNRRVSPFTLALSDCYKNLLRRTLLFATLIIILRASPIR